MVCVLSCLTLWDPMDCSLPGSSAYGIFQARILDGVAIPTPGDCPDSKIKPTSLVSPALAGGFFTTTRQCSIIGKAVLKMADRKIICVAKSPCCNILLFTLLSLSFSTSKVVKTKDHFFIFFPEPASLLLISLSITVI